MHTNHLSIPNKDKIALYTFINEFYTLQCSKLFFSWEIKYLIEDQNHSKITS